MTAAADHAVYCALISRFIPFLLFARAVERLNTLRAFVYGINVRKTSLSAPRRLRTSAGSEHDFFACVPCAPYHTRAVATNSLRVCTAPHRPPCKRTPLSERTCAICNSELVLSGTLLGDIKVLRYVHGKPARSTDQTSGSNYSYAPRYPARLRTAPTTG